jgi:hypothetical protein
MDFSRTTTLSKSMVMYYPTRTLSFLGPRSAPAASPAAGRILRIILSEGSDTQPGSCSFLQTTNESCVIPVDMDGCAVTVKRGGAAKG